MLEIWIYDKPINDILAIYGFSKRGNIFKNDSTIKNGYLTPIFLSAKRFVSLSLEIFTSNKATKIT